jgi:hypothetical protein
MSRASFTREDATAGVKNPMRFDCRTARVNRLRKELCSARSCNYQILRRSVLHAQPGMAVPRTFSATCKLVPCYKALFVFVRLEAGGSPFDSAQGKQTRPYAEQQRLSPRRPTKKGLRQPVCRGNGGLHLEEGSYILRLNSDGRKLKSASG